MTNETQQSCFELAVELTKGPALFDEIGQPTDAVLRYTGGRVEQDSERCLVAGALRLLGCSDREIARVVKCDTRSIPLMMGEAERTGRIPALKDRLAKLTGANAERAQIALRDLLDRASAGNCTVELAAMVKAVATAGGINTQNLQLLTGGATEILEVRVGAGRAEIEAWARANAIDVGPSDGQSSGAGAICGGMGRQLAAPTVHDTAVAETGGGGADGRAGGGGDALTGSKILVEVPRA